MNPVYPAPMLAIHTNPLVDAILRGPPDYSRALKPGFRNPPNKGSKAQKKGNHDR